MLRGLTSQLELRHALEDLPLRDHYVRAIVAAHALKMVRVAFDESAALSSGPWRALPLLGVVRFAAAPIRERPLGRLVHEARRLVIEGSVPRTLT